MTSDLNKSFNGLKMSLETLKSTSSKMQGMMRLARHHGVCKASWGLQGMMGFARHDGAMGFYLIYLLKFSSL